MALPDSYTQKFNAVPAYFDAMLDAQPPERFSVKFIENLGFTSTNDRLFISILKELGFLNRDGAPQQRYFDFLDRSRSKQVVAAGVREAFADLFALNVRANELGIEEIKNKLRTLYAGKKTDVVIDRIAKTFKALCDYADFSSAPATEMPATPAHHERPKDLPPNAEGVGSGGEKQGSPHGRIAVSGLQYHINIVLPDTRDQAVYEAIFKSLRDHLG
jgi:hypothetical protein